MDFAIKRIWTYDFLQKYFPKTKLLILFPMGDIFHSDCTKFDKKLYSDIFVAQKLI